MKKLFTFILSLLLVGAYTTASAQQNIYVWKDGNLSVVSAASIDSVSFSVDFNITTSAAFSVTNSSFKVVASVSLNDKVKSFSVLPEVGVCYSDENRKPTYEDSCVPLGAILQIIPPILVMFSRAQHTITVPMSNCLTRCTMIVM